MKHTALILGFIASVITIFVFLSGKSSVDTLLGDSAPMEITEAQEKEKDFSKSKSNPSQCALFGKFLWIAAKAVFLVVVLTVLSVVTVGVFAGFDADGDDVGGAIFILFFVYGFFLFPFVFPDTGHGQWFLNIIRDA